MLGKISFETRSQQSRNNQMNNIRMKMEIMKQIETFFYVLIIDYAKCKMQNVNFVCYGCEVCGIVHFWSSFTFPIRDFRL